jgi:outer membrane receptor protein involved in Fe transport
VRYIGNAGMSPFVTRFPELGSRAYHDVRVSYTFGEERNSEAFGVNNLTNEQPPFFASGTAGTQALDTIPGYYDVFGRSIVGGARMRF